MTSPTGRDRAVRRCAAVLADDVGLAWGPAMAGRLGRCVEDAATSRGETREAFAGAVERDPAARADLVDRVTVQETAFFRDPAQMADLAEHVLPAVADPVRVWSAGCSNGQEPYGIAMLLEEAGRNGTVLATDVARPAVARTSAARFSAAELRGLGRERSTRHLAPLGDGFVVRRAVANRVTAKAHHLLQPAPGQAHDLDVVVCRNVLIYLSADSLERAVDLLASALAPGGVLLLGYAESLGAARGDLVLERIGRTYAYRRRRTAPVRTVPRDGPARPTPRRRAGQGAASAAVPGSPDVDREAALLSAVGEEAAADGANHEAAAAFRAAGYLRPGSAVTHLRLGLALDAAGEDAAAARAYRTAGAVWPSAGETFADALDDWSPGEARALLDARLAALRRGDPLALGADSRASPRADPQSGRR